jgi:hypothetical protein
MTISFSIGCGLFSGKFIATVAPMGWYSPPYTKIEFLSCSSLLIHEETTSGKEKLILEAFKIT